MALQRRVEDAAEFAQVYLDWKRASDKRVPFGASQVLHCLTAQKKLKVKKVSASDGSASAFAVAASRLRLPHGGGVLNGRHAAISIHRCRRRRARGDKGGGDGIVGC